MAALTYSRLEGALGRGRGVDMDGSALQQHCSMIMHHQGPSSGQGTMSLFNICKLLIPEDSAP